MKLQPAIQEIEERKLVGFFANTTLLTNASHTKSLFQNLMPLRQSIDNALPGAYYSLQVYQEDLDFRTFTPQTEYFKWAAIEVSQYHENHKDFAQMCIPSGTYAVFHFKGSIQTFPQLIKYIHGDWLPKSKYVLDNRPHFELLDDHYSPRNTENEEEVWVPIKLL